MPLVTVPGVGSSTIEVQFQSAENTFRAESLLAQVYAAHGNGTLSVANAPTVSPADPQMLNEYAIGDEGGAKGAGPTQGVVPKGYLAIIDNQLSAIPVQVVGADQDNESVLATGSLQFSTAGGSGTLISAQGNNVVAAPNQGGGDWNIYFDSGNNTVYAGSGNFLIETDTSVTFGRNLLFLGAGSDTVISWGQDTIVGSPASNDLVALFHGNSVFYACGGTSTVLDMAGSDTVVLGGAGTVYAASRGGLYYGGAGPLTFIGGPNAASTVVAGAGDATLYGGAAGTYIVGSGDFVLNGGSGDQTVVGVQGVAGNALLFADNGGAINLLGNTDNVLAAGAGGAVLNAMNASGNNLLFGGPGADCLMAGGGADTLVASAGADTLVSGAGPTTFEANAALAGGGHELIAKWKPADQLWLVGYGAATAPGGLPAGATFSTVGGSALLSLRDGTSITFLNVANVNPAQIHLA